MSGPKTSSYYVSENELRRRRAIQEALEETANLASQVASIYQKIRDFNKNPPMREMHIVEENISVSEISNSNNLTEIENYNRKVRALVEKLASELTKESHRQQLEASGQTEIFQTALNDINRSISAGLDKQTETAADVIKNHKQETSSVAKKIDKIKSAVVRNLQRVPAGIPFEKSKEVEKIASIAYDAANSSEANKYVDQLRILVKEACDYMERVTKDSQEATDLLEKIRGYDSAALRLIKEELKSVVEKKIFLDQSLKDRLNNEYEKAKQKIDQQYVEESISSALKELGYDVEEGFTTLFADKNTIKLQKPGWNDYFVKFLLSKEDKAITCHVIRVDDGNPLTNERKIRDQEMETKWCQDFYKLNHTLTTKGIQPKIKRQKDPGDVRVAVIKDETTSERVNQRTVSNRSVDQKKLNIK